MRRLQGALDRGRWWLDGVLNAALEKRRAPAHMKVVPFAGVAAEQELRSKFGPWLFFPDLSATPTPKDEQRTYKTISRAMTRALKAAGLPGRFTPHSLRHSFGSLLIAAAVSPAYVQQQMGHTSIAMTVDVYGSWLPIRVDGAVDRLAAATSGTGDMLVTFGPREAVQAVRR